MKILTRFRRLPPKAVRTDDVTPLDRSSFNVRVEAGSIREDCHEEDEIYARADHREISQAVVFIEAAGSKTWGKIGGKTKNSNKNR